MADRNVLLTPVGPPLELEPGRFGQLGPGVQFRWHASWGAYLLSLDFHDLERGPLLSPLLSWIVEALELDGAEQLLGPTPLPLVNASLATLPRVRPDASVRLVVRLGTLDAKLAAVDTIAATHARLTVTPPRVYSDGG